MQFKRLGLCLFVSQPKITKDLSNPNKYWLQDIIAVGVKGIADAAAKLVTQI